MLSEMPRYLDRLFELLTRSFELLMRRLGGGIILAICLATTNTAQAVDFDHEVVPILRNHCVKCHGGNEAKGGFSLNSRKLFLEGEAADPGNPAASYFLELIRSTNVDSQMPPKDLPRVSTEEQLILTRWVSEQMPWTSGFSFSQSRYQPPLLPRKVPLTGSPETHPIDQILDQYLNTNKLPPLESVDDATFLRRAYLDLVGLLPTPEQLQAFLADRSDRKRSQLIDELLARDLDYTEHWLTFWNDLLRNDYTGTGFITGGRQQISAWLYRALIENKPFDEFTRELIAPESGASRGFIDGIKWRGNVSAGQTNEIQFAQSVAQSFLGINLKCASCHDSFIDRWTLDEAYSLAAIYAQKPLEIHRCDKPINASAQPGWLFPELGNVDPKAPRNERLKQLAALVTHRNNGRYTRTIVNRLWGQLMGRGLVHPLDAMHTEPWNEDLLDFLAEYLVESQYDLKAVLRLIATSAAYGSRSEVLPQDPTNQTNYVFQGRRTKRLTAEQFMDAVWQLTGASPTDFDAPVIRGQTNLGKDDQGTDENPAALRGEWIWGDSAADGKAPPAGEKLVFRKTVHLPAKVTTAVVTLTADNDFELYVGRRRLATGKEWTRPQTVVITKNLKPGDNEWIVVAGNGGASPNLAGLYLEARVAMEDETVIEVSSDSSWQYSERLPTVKSPGRLGKPVGPWRPVVSLGRPGVYAQVNDPIRRGLTMAMSSNSNMVRASLVKSDFLMRSLGRPNRDQIVTSRPSELTTLEAIDLANGQTLATALQRGANQWTDSEQSTASIVRELFQFALSRQPTAAELSVIQESLGHELTAEACEDLLWSICMMPEFMMVR